MEESSNSSFSSTSATVSDEERRRYLDSLQARDNLLLIPTVVFLATVAIVGFVGNSLVFIAYWRKARRNATDVFIMAIAATDFLTNVFAIPNEIYDLFHFWDFDNTAQCKARVYLNTLASMTSACFLLAVAITRYKKVCRPHGNQTSVKVAKLVLILIVAICSFLAVPQPILYGIKTRETAKINITGHECHVSDEYAHTIWPMISTGFLIVLFMIVYISLIVFYVLICRKAWKHSRRHGISVIAKWQSTPENIDNAVKSKDATNATMVPPQGKNMPKKGSNAQGTLNRTTVMLISVTSVYLIAFLPYFILSLLKVTSSSFYENLSPAGESSYNVFLRFFAINSAANAIIYSIWDPGFRLEVIKIFKCRK